MNNCTFIGHIGKDAELANAGNSMICKFNIANNVGYGDKQTTMWINCNLWGKRGQSLSQYLVKGTKVVVIGELSENEYNGKKYLQLNVNQVELLGDRNQQQQQERPQTQQFAQPQAQQFAQPQTQQPQTQQAQQQSEFNPFDTMNSAPF